MPIALEGTDKVMPKHGGLHRAHVTATIGKPMTAAEMLAAYPDASKDALTIISEATMRAIASLMPEPVTLLKEAPEDEKEAAAAPAEAEPKGNPAKQLAVLLALGMAGAAVLLVARSKHR